MYNPAFGLDIALPLRTKPVADATFDPSVISTPHPHPRDIPLAVVSGGFNAVVQVAAKLCARIVGSELGFQFHSVALTSTRVATLFAKPPSFETPELDALRTTPSKRKLWIVTMWSVSSVRFSAPKRVSLRFRGRVALGWFDPPLIPSTPTAAASPVFSRPALDTTNDAAASFVGGTLEEAGGLFTLSGTLDEVIDPAFFSPVAMLGDLSCDVDAPYILVADPARKRADVYAELDKAKVVLEPNAPDVQELLNSGLLGAKGVDAIAALLDASRIRLCPTLSLLGRNAAHLPVPELPDFEALTFHVERGIEQALAIAFDLKPGCHGTVEEVRHFLGAADFGTISDEFLVERVFRHKWANGGVQRFFTTETSAKVKAGGDQVVDAAVYGTLVLKSLDLIALEALSDVRMDVLRLRGSATARIDRVRLADGSEHYSPSPEYLGFAPESMDWGLLLGLMEGSASISGDLAGFVRTIYRDAYQHVAFPFARMQDHQITLSYARFDAINRRVFHLGRVREVFV